LAKLPSTVAAAVMLGILNTGCYREMIIYQARDFGENQRQIEIDTSQLPPGTVNTMHADLDLFINPSALRVIRPRYPIRIIIVPATQPSPVLNSSHPAP
jgi:hypothetical protein